jgi:small subunit ribosomal protein S16
VLRIRLRRVGKKKQPSYRVVVADSRAPRDGAFVETIGTYNPLTHPETITLDEERARHWLSKGASPSERVVRILASKGIGEMPVYAPRPKKEKAAPEAATAVAEKPAAEPPPAGDDAAAEQPAADEAPADAPAVGESEA